MILELIQTTHKLIYYFKIHSKRKDIKTNKNYFLDKTLNFVFYIYIIKKIVIKKTIKEERLFQNMIVKTIKNWQFKLLFVYIHIYIYISVLKQTYISRLHTHTHTHKLCVWHNFRREKKRESHVISVLMQSSLTNHILNGIGMIITRSPRIIKEYYNKVINSRCNNELKNISAPVLRVQPFVDLTIAIYGCCGIAITKTKS